jgi:hypothetical protein
MEAIENGKEVDPQKLKEVEQQAKELSEGFE